MVDVRTSPSGKVVSISGGLNPPLNPAENNRVAIGFNGDLVYTIGGADGEVLQTQVGAAVWATLDIADTSGNLPAGRLSGIVAVGNGGTGVAAPGVQFNLLVSDGAGAWVPMILPIGATSGLLPTSRLSGTVAIANGGTNLSGVGAANTVLTSSGGVLVYANVALVNTSGTLATGRGGTGLTVSGAAGQVLRSDGAVWASAVLALADTSGTLLFGRGGTGITAVGAAGNVLRSTGALWASAVLPIADTSGTLARGRGGTGLTVAGANGNVLTSNGTDWTSAAPSGGGDAEAINLFKTGNQSLSTSINDVTWNGNRTHNTAVYNWAGTGNSIIEVLKAGVFKVVGWITANPSSVTAGTELEIFLVVNGSALSSAQPQEAFSGTNHDVSICFEVTREYSINDDIEIGFSVSAATTGNILANKCGVSVTFIGDTP